MFHLVLMTIRDLIAQHIVWLLPIGAILLVVMMPSAALAVLSFLTRTVAGQIITACVVSLLIGWSGRGYVDDTAQRRLSIVAARQAAKDAQAREAAADALLAEVRRQVKQSDELIAEARDRADTNEAAVLSYQKRESDYEAELSTRPGDACGLSDADVRSLQHAAGAYARRPASAGPAAGARKFWSPRHGA